MTPLLLRKLLLFGVGEKIDDWELLDFSGFIDVNGEELYESDIYTWKSQASPTDIQKRRVAVVEHSIGNDGDGYHASGFTLACGWQDTFEKIGNWWENPEMREEVRNQKEIL